MKLSLASILLASAIGRASTVYTVNESITLNPNAIITSGGTQSYLVLYSGQPPVNLQPGDELTGTVSFIDGPIFIEAPAGDYNESVSIYFQSPSSPSTGFSSNIDFLGLQGMPGESNPTTVINFSGGPLAVLATDSGNAAVFSFTGFTYTINLTSESTSPSPFSFTQFGVVGQMVEFGVTAPEPSTIAMCGSAGVVLALAALRRRRSRQ